MKYNNQTFLQWVSDARLASDEWRADSWEDFEFYNGKQATDQEKQDFLDKGIEYITINRIFPVVNLILGSQQLNNSEVVAKARTQADAQNSQTMTESIKFVMDQNGGIDTVNEGFADAVVGGFGCLQVGINEDPRKEKIKVVQRPWGNVGWDPFGSPWFNKNTCRYVYQDKWMDVSDLQAMFPGQAKDIENQYRELSETVDSNYYSDYSSLYDIGDLIEEKRGELLTREWADLKNRRVRPVELWYYRYCCSLFALFPDGRVIELTDCMEPMQQLEIIRAASEVVKANVRKMFVTAFFGKVELMHQPSPHNHDEFPFVPFVGYLDRYGFPFGVPRQVKSQNIEVNKRRSMALALMNSRRIVHEEGASIDPQTTYEESNRLDGHVVLRNGQMANFQIDELSGLAAPQVEMLRQSELEIQEISGANNEMMGYNSNITSGVGMAKKQEQGAKVTASLLTNRGRSLKRLGELIQSGIQQHWTGPKVLRVMDSLTGAERFIELNKPVQTPTGEIVYENNITQGRYDIVISEAVQTDTVRERNLNMLIEWVKRAPSELIPHLFNVAMEISDLPNKDMLLAKLKPMLGTIPGEEDMSPEQVKQQVLEQIQAQNEENARQKQVEDTLVQLELENKALENAKLEAEIEKTMEDAESGRKKADAAKADVAIKAFKTGVDVKKDMGLFPPDAMNVSQKGYV